MPLSPGVCLGPYEIVAAIGAGGMGEVYRARDTRLGRDVAIKILPDDLARNLERLQRFEREGRIASGLSHPHIVTVHDVGEFDGRYCLITEFVDGGTLRSWARAAPRDTAAIVELLTGAADGLAAAHDAGVVHRDVKPENILVTRSGYAKVADFGLAKLREAAPGDEAGTVMATRAGMMTGTAAYMSPEQALAQPLDARTDVFSFGVVLFELLAGRHPFTGASDVDTLHAIVHGNPEPLPASVPAAARRIVERALQRAPDDRFQSMHDVVAELRRAARHGGESQPATGRRHWRRALTQATGAAAMVVAATLLWRARGPAEPPVRTAATYTQLTDFDSAVQPALSADGRMLAFVRGPETGIALLGAVTQIYVKALPGGDPVQLTRDPTAKFAPQFSPDGTRIAYATLEASGFNTWIVPVFGGQEPRRLRSNAEGLTWIPGTSASGAREPRLLFSQLTGKGITMAVATATESGADERTVFAADGIMDHFSFLSPDGRQLLLAEMGFEGWQPCRLAPADGASTGRKIGPARSPCTGAAWSPDGEWMYVSADTGSGFHIWRERFPSGIPEQITFGASEEEGLALAPDGRSLLTSIGTRQSTLWVHDARGDRQITSDAFAFMPAFSADERTLYYLVRTPGGKSNAAGGLWAADLPSGERRRLLPEFQMEHYTVSRDSRRIVFVSPRGADRPGVWTAALDGSAAPRRLAAANAWTAFFGAGDEVIFAADQADRTFVYRVREDGSGARQALPQPVRYLYGVSPDGASVAVWGIAPPDAATNAVLVYPLAGGPARIVCGNNCAYRGDGSVPQELSWSADGTRLYLALLGGSEVYAVPLAAGQTLPPLGPGGLRSVDDAAALPGARLFPVPAATPAADPSIYAYPKFTAQRNIFRVAVP